MSSSVSQYIGNVIIVDRKIIGTKYFRNIIFVLWEEMFLVRFRSGFLITSSLAWAIATRKNTEDVVENLIPEFTTVVNVCRCDAGIARKNESMQRRIVNVAKSVLDVNMAAKSKLKNFPFLSPDETKTIPIMLKMRPMMAMTKVECPLMM